MKFALQLDTCHDLDFCHANDVIHRDLKPENIFLVNGTGRLRLVRALQVRCYNYYSKKHTKLTDISLMHGTRDYVPTNTTPPPVQLLKGSDSTTLVDNWGSSVLCYDLLRGTTPVDADKNAEIVNKIGKVRYSFPSHLTLKRAAKDVLGKLLKLSLQAVISCTLDSFKWPAACYLRLKTLRQSREFEGNQRVIKVEIDEWLKEEISEW